MYESDLGQQFLGKSQVVYLQCCDATKIKGHCPRPMFNCVDWVLHTCGGTRYIEYITDLHKYYNSLSEGGNTVLVLMKSLYTNSVLADGGIVS